MKVDTATAPWYLIPLAIGNFLGPLLLGQLFDTVGRRVMITLTYVLSGLLLILTGVLFDNGSLSANTLTAMWCVVFFFASAGASAAYLTVSEIFPMETRAMAIAFFYAVGTGLGGIIGPILFGKFIEQGRDQVVVGYYIGAGLMIAAGLVAMFLARRRRAASLEDVAEPLTAQDAEAWRDDREIDLRDGRRSDSDDDYAGSSPVGSSTAPLPLDRRSAGSGRTPAQGGRTETQRQQHRPDDDAEVDPRARGDLGVRRHVAHRVDGVGQRQHGSRSRAARRAAGRAARAARRAGTAAARTPA